MCSLSTCGPPCAGGGTLAAAYALDPAGRPRERLQPAIPRGTDRGDDASALLMRCKRGSDARADGGETARSRVRASAVHLAWRPAT
ncbi:hypothetical protein FTX61_17665 [Nitriliruptoraceae bacterium ZYF776]|nr:hypothetical protein [Profundirhabdus halotolerans]